MSFALQLISHGIGDYLLQSGWMANNKTKREWPALVHACTYFVPFWILLHPSMQAAMVMIATHFAIDHFRLARYVAYAKEFLSPPSEWKPWKEYSATGYHESTPPFLAVWLMIITDNLLHIIINALALYYL
jgi:Protein of unknown function (DUF3307)